VSKTSADGSANSADPVRRLVRHIIPQLAPGGAAPPYLIPSRLF
jgi:hypothetical protein